MAWKKVKLGDIIKPIKNHIEISDDVEYKQVTIKLWGKGIKLRGLKYGSEIKVKRQNVAKNGDFIISKIDARHNAFGFISDELDDSIVSNDFPLFEVNLKLVRLDFFKELVKLPLFEDFCKKASSGTTNRIRLSIPKFLNIDLIIPVDFIEQEKIFNKLQSTKYCFDNFKLNFENQQNYIKKLRESILQEAVQGKLVEQNSSDESAEILFEKIRKEKEQLIKDKKIKKEKPLPEISADEIPYELPSGWKWCRLGDVVRFIDYRGKTPTKTDYGVRLLTAKNVKKGFINLNPEEFISVETYNNYMTRGFPKKNDILITTEAPLGNVANLILDEKVAFAQRVIILQDYISLNKIFLKYVLLSKYFQNLLIFNQSGMTAKGIKSSRLKNLLVPLPPLEEQKRIVKKVDSLMSFCDILESEVLFSKKSAEDLMQSVLREAFSEK